MQQSAEESPSLRAHAEDEEGRLEVALPTLPRGAVTCIMHAVWRQELPSFSAQDLYENKVMFSRYGVKIRNQDSLTLAEMFLKREARRAKTKDLGRSPDSAQQCLLSVKSMNSMHLGLLNQSHSEAEARAVSQSSPPQEGLLQLVVWQVAWHGLLLQMATKGLDGGQ